MFNRVEIIGNVGAVPEVRITDRREKITSFRVATNETWKDREGKPVEKTEWHKVVAYKSLANYCEKKLSKGSLVFIEGKLSNREWEKNGEKRITTEIIAFTVRVLKRGE